MTCRGCRAVTCLLLLVISPSGSAGQKSANEFAVELLFGTAWSLPLPITIDVSGERSRFTARWRTRPLAEAPYYSLRLSRADGGREVEVEMLHHKLYLGNPQPPVESFAVSHGFNQAMINLAGKPGGWQWRLGVGVVVAHPEGRIGGRNVGPLRTLLGGGYHIVGISTQAAVGRCYALGNSATALTAAPEVKLTAAFARIRISGGTVWVPNVAAHALGGIGIRRR
jgi:hypothetical protein